MKKLMMALAVPAVLIGCSKDNKPKKPTSDNVTSLFWMQEAQVITITTVDGSPIQNAQILIGDALNAPFSGNFLTTDANGQVAIPAAWTTVESVTVAAPGYVRATYFAQEPGPISFKLRAQPTKTQYEVKGVSSGLPIQDKDGFVDFALVMPAFTKLDMLAFDINNVISPQTDRISAMGQDIDVPANISLPKQSEKYSLFTITLDKPNYRIYYGQQGVNRVFAARGRFPFKSTVDALRDGAEFYELINDFKITGGAVRDIEIKSGQTKLDMPTRELNFTETKAITAPQYRADEMFIAVGIANQSGYMIPTDVKKIAQGKSANLNALTGSDQKVLGVLKRTAEMKSGNDRMSATLLPFTAGTKPEMLPLIADPTIAADGEILMPKFNTVAGVNPIATYSVLSKEEEVQQGGAKVKILQPQWEVYSQNWLERMKLPQWPNDQAIAGKKRWEVNFVGSQTASQAPVGPAMIEAATHVTHSSVSF
ncbi:carboxypeptidase-like regulatory domain-containing protein [Bdellovibrio bacteriovorus]|uniref:carboxypeptidase-like regulatory domain-containing protein n=1 Tax=Bdellovibrio bacteriovorus TaxID=959 RepID=UPI0035A59ADE